MGEHGQWAEVLGVGDLLVRSATRYPERDAREVRFIAPGEWWMSVTKINKAHWCSRLRRPNSAWRAALRAPLSEPTAEPTTD
ncbi:hypothetical protein [Saccharopolyspora spinosa]|uniref:Uncharacterized protein n=1 Tax=Saccharopolyspora spinosa TaxID=60894 RepID=A0A2N3Y0G7_SACSN|nr:hypothetical protein [Saccharopolyspora spinosa]PKW16393.1 hypothetical protein A8926_4221 [Saccharopolyspora spinosa]